MRKSKRARGDAYIGATGKCMPAKAFKSYKIHYYAIKLHTYVCSCLKKCNNVINETKKKKIAYSILWFGKLWLTKCFYSWIGEKNKQKKSLYNLNNVDG